MDTKNISKALMNSKEFWRAERRVCREKAPCISGTKSTVQFDYMTMAWSVLEARYG